MTNETEHSDRLSTDEIVAGLKALHDAEMAWRADPAGPPPRHLEGFGREELLRMPPPPEPGGPPCEVVREWIDGTPYDPDKPGGPFEDTRATTEEGPPYPSGLIDPLSADLVDSVRYLLLFIFHNFWDSPKWMAWMGTIWQWKKFEFLDWLRPVELLLRRLVMIEALSLLASQALPPRKFKPEAPAGQAAPSPRKPRPRPEFDIYNSEGWKISFNVIPRGFRPPRSDARPRRKLAPVNPDFDYFARKKTALRYRRVLHSMLPLAKRLEAVIRVVTDPAPFARRTAFRLRARASLNADLLLVDPPKRRLQLARDALRSARDRIRQLYGPVFELYWSSA